MIWDTEGAMEIHPRFMKCIENPCEVYLHRFWTEAELHKKKEGTEGLKNSIRKKKAQREVLPGEDEEDQGDKKDKEDENDKRG